MFVQWGLGGGGRANTLLGVWGERKASARGLKRLRASRFMSFASSPLHSPCFLEVVDFFYVFFGVYFYINFLADVLICWFMFMSIYSYCSSTMPSLGDSSALTGRN